jgi:plasmid stabilization system protein ParE
VKYRVRLTAKAQEDIESILEWFRDQSAALSAARWFAQLMDRIATLESQPTRCASAAEAEELGLEIRELLVGRRGTKYRLLFQIQGRTVFILRVWHSSRDAVSREDL